MRVRFIKLWDYKQFEFLPRYYNKEAEDLESRVAVTSFDAQQEKKDELYREHIAAAFKRRDRQEKQPIYIRLVIVAILTGLLIVSYFWTIQL